MSPQLNLTIVGGGASGFFTAVELASQCPNLSIRILEAGAEPLTKVKVSGGGRCNVTHSLFDPEILSNKYPRGSKELRQTLSHFQPKDTIQWFSQRGVELKTEADGRMFPTTNQSQTIIQCFLEEAKKYKVEVLLSSPVLDVRNRDSRFSVVTQKENFESDFLLMATGSNRKPWEWMAKMGHSIVPPVPSLFTLNIPDPRLEGLAGQSVPMASVKINPKGKPQIGPMLVTHWGLSGPAVLRLSAWEARNFADSDYKITVSVNWLGEKRPMNLQTDLQTFKEKNPAKLVSNSPIPEFSQRLWQRFLENAKTPLEKRWSEVSKEEVGHIVQEICEAKYCVVGKSTNKDEFVTCGGISRKEVNFKTMESKIIPNLFFAGEVLDVDGITGGFNFQHAWTSGYLASQTIALRYANMARSTDSGIS